MSLYGDVYFGSYILPPCWFLHIPSYDWYSSSLVKPSSSSWSHAWCSYVFCATSHLILGGNHHIFDGRGKLLLCQSLQSPSTSLVHHLCVPASTESPASHRIPPSLQSIRYYKFCLWLCTRIFIIDIMALWTSKI